MTSTAIGILLIVQLVVLWAIMAALHRHTSQLKALRERIDLLRRMQGPDATEASSDDPAERFRVHTDANTSAEKRRPGR